MIGFGRVQASHASGKSVNYAKPDSHPLRCRRRRVRKMGGTCAKTSRGPRREDVLGSPSYGGAFFGPKHSKHSKRKQSVKFGEQFGYMLGNGGGQWPGTSRNGTWMGRGGPAHGPMTLTWT